MGKRCAELCRSEEVEVLSRDDARGNEQGREALLTFPTNKSHCASSMTSTVVSIASCILGLVLSPAAPLMLLSRLDLSTASHWGVGVGGRVVGGLELSVPLQRDSVSRCSGT